MPRVAKPRWYLGRRRWYGNVGERDDNGRRREVFAPPEFGERDESQAWKWLRKEQTRDRTEPQQSGEILADQIAAASIGLVTQASGATKNASSELANEMIRHGANATNFYNMPFEIRLEKIRSGLVGVVEPMRASGALLPETAIQEEGLVLGLICSEKEIDGHSKVVA